ncbi:UDP-2,3-diacylglucosamine diphosphatase [Candidatus Fermentibacteria bacterium]|nr:UDP-2,3-diacylglucosamine diphosphatase [Candidatus Fermentibacteria bacterium]
MTSRPATTNDRGRGRDSASPFRAGGISRLPTADSRLLIFSDLHLPQLPTQESVARVDELAEMLAVEAPRATHIVLLGDIFDFWFEYPHVVPGGFHRLLCALRDLVGQGKDVVLFPGNHDFWLGNFFPREIGVRVAEEREIWNVGARRIMLTHGDGLNPSDRGYHLLKRLLRNRAAIRAFGLLHPEVAFWLARSVSRLSRQSAEYKRTWKNDRYIPFARRCIAEGIDTVVVAHTHTAQTVDLAPGLLVNPGDWLRRRSFARIDAERTGVLTWPERSVLPLQALSEIGTAPLGGGKMPG